MLVDFSFALKNMNEEILKESDKNITAGLVVIRALITDSSEKESGMEKFNKFKLALSIDKSVKDNIPLEINEDEIALIKKMVGEFFTTMIVGQIYLLLGQ